MSERSVTMTDLKQAAIKAAAKALRTKLPLSYLDYGHYQDIAEAAIASSEAALWQPIEKAPRDGTCVILEEGGETYAGYFETRPNHWKETGWQDESARSDYLSRHPNNPTHYRLLPDPPKAMECCCMDSLNVRCPWHSEPRP